MTKITASEVNKLRKQTGAGMMDCKKALVEASGNFDEAVDILRKKGQKVAAKRADRETSEGVVLSITSDDNKSGAVMSLNCETDFVAKNSDFVMLAFDIIKLGLKNKSSDIENLKSLKFNSEISIEEKLTEQTGVIGEKIELSNFKFIEAEYVKEYIHTGNKLASIVAFSSSPENIDEVGKNVAMQIAAMNPIALNEEQVSKEIVDKEIEIGKDLARQEGKPENMLEKIASGRLKKFFKENTLVNQIYIKDSKMTVGHYLKEIDADLNIVSFERVSLT